MTGTPDPGGGGRRAGRALARRPGRCSTTSTARFGRGRRRCGPAHGHSRGGRHPGRGAARRAGCWCRAGRGVVRLPGEVQVALRGGHTTREPGRRTARGRDLVARVRAWSTGRRPARRSRRYAAWSCCSTTGAAARRSRCAAAASSVRDLKAAADDAQLDEPAAALRASRSPPRPGCWPPGPTPTATRRGCPPTPSTLVRRARPPTAGRRLARAWLDTERLPGPGRHPRRRRQAAQRPRPRADQPDRPGDPADDAGRRWPGCPTGEVLATGTGPPSLVARIAWLRPRRPPLPRRPGRGCRSTSRPTSGVTGLGGLASYARALLAGDDPGRRCSRRCCPQQVDHVLVQADLTAVAPGPLESRARPRPAAARRRRVARRGDGLPVHRPRRYAGRFDAGWAAHEVHAFLAVGVADPGAAAADLPRRRRRPHLRDGPGRARRGVPARRRRGRADRAAAPPAGRLAGAAAARPDRADQHHAARRPPPAAARPRRRAAWWRPPTAPSTSPGPTGCGPGPARPRVVRRTVADAHVEAQAGAGRHGVRAGDRVAADPRRPAPAATAHPDRVAGRAARGGRGRAARC